MRLTEGILLMGHFNIFIIGMVTGRVSGCKSSLVETTKRGNKSVMYLNLIAPDFSELEARVLAELDIREYTAQSTKR